jgi:hypothetical protein
VLAVVFLNAEVTPMEVLVVGPLAVAAELVALPTAEDGAREKHLAIVVVVRE